MINLVEILKNFLGKENFKLRCELVSGFVYLYDIKENGDIIIKTEQEDQITLDSFGRLIGGNIGRCLLWPDTHKDWAALKNNEKPKYTHIQDLGIKLEELADYELSHLKELISEQLKRIVENRETEIKNSCHRFLDKYQNGQKTFWSRKYSGEIELITVTNIFWKEELEKGRDISLSQVYFDVIEIDENGYYTSWEDCMTTLIELLPYKELNEEVMKSIKEKNDFYKEKLIEIGDKRARELMEIIKTAGIS